jgi:hypothetical protein
LISAFFFVAAIEDDAEGDRNGFRNGTLHNRMRVSQKSRHLLKKEVTYSEPTRSIREDDFFDTGVTAFSSSRSARSNPGCRRKRG